MQADHPTPTHADTDRVFDIGENDIVLVHERTDAAGVIRYVVTFKDAAPTSPAVDEAIELMRVFADIAWDFELLCDMRAARLLSQLAHAPAYSRLIGLIQNPHCKHCFIFIRRLPKIVGPVCSLTIGGIVAALGVSCTMIEMGGLGGDGVGLRTQ